MTQVQTTHQEKALQNLALVHLDFDIWSGQAKLRASDLKVAEGDLPPETVANLGTKRICPAEHLRAFHTIKARARRLLMEWGRPFLGGFAIPIVKLSEVQKGLQKIEDEFNIKKTLFIRGYQEAVRAWMDENPEYADAIARGVLTEQEVSKRIGCDWQVIEVGPIQDGDAKNRLRARVDGLGDEVINEITERAQDFYENNLLGRESCSGATKPTLKNLRDKVDGLSFLNSNLAALVRLLDNTLQGYNLHTKSNTISGAFFYQVMASILILSDRKKIESYAAGSITVEEMQKELYQPKAESQTEAQSLQEVQGRQQGQDLFEPASEPEADVPTSRNFGDSAGDLFF